MSKVERLNSVCATRVSHGIPSTTNRLTDGWGRGWKDEAKRSEEGGTYNQQNTCGNSILSHTHIYIYISPSLSLSLSLLICFQLTALSLSHSVSVADEFGPLVTIGGAATLNAEHKEGHTPSTSGATTKAIEISITTIQWGTLSTTHSCAR